MPMDAESKLGLEDFREQASFYGEGMIKPIKDTAVTLAELIFDNCPSSSERTQAMIHVDQALMYAAAAIQRHPR